jgi:general nucleoside transport system permease protein
MAESVVTIASALAAQLGIAQALQVGQAVSAFWHGSIGSEYAILSATLVRATPLIFTGLAVALAFRAGVLNIGAEGQFLAGATGAAVVGAWAATWSAAHQTVVGLPLALVAGCVLGAGWAGVAAFLKRRFGVLEVISTIMLNFIALEGVGYLVRGPLQEPSRVYPQTPSLPNSLHLPILVPGTRLHLGFALAVVAGVVAWWALRTTAWGFRLRVSGASPAAAASAGQIDVSRVTTRAFLVSGAIAGLAGAVEVTGVAFALYDNISPGYGYTAIAVALLANLNPLGVVASGVFFGALEAGAGAMQRDAGVPSVVVSVVEAGIVLVILGVQALRVMPGAIRLPRLSPRGLASASTGPNSGPNS